MVMFNFKLNQKEKKSMFILGLISFAVWFVNPFYGAGYLSDIFESIYSSNSAVLLRLLEPFFGAFFNCFIYLIYLKLPKHKILDVGFTITILVLLLWYLTLTLRGLYIG